MSSTENPFETPGPAASQPEFHMQAQAAWPPAPRCEVCGRQDETLRLSAYPYVYSIIVMTFRRGFTGVWCRRHRNRYWLLATAITSIAGWLGIPFGFLYTPLALFKLVQGGNQPATDNMRLLRSLSADKIRKGDIEGARSCLEAALQFKDDPAIKDELHRLPRTTALLSPSATEPGIIVRIYPLVCLLAGAAIIGFAVGLGVYFFTGLIFTPLQNQSSIYIDILSWIPLVAFAMINLVVLRQILEWALDKARVLQTLPAVLLGLASGMLAVYGLPDGRAAGMFIEDLHNEPLHNLADVLLTVGAVLTRGGILEIKNAFQEYGAYGLIYLTLFSGIALLYLYTLQNSATWLSAWKQRLVEQQDQWSSARPASVYTAWIALAGLLVVIFGFVAAFPQQSVVDYLEAINHTVKAYHFQQNGQLEQAKQEYLTAIHLRPGFVIAHSYLGWAYLQSDQFDESAAEFQETLRLNPNFVVAYDGLGWVNEAKGDYQNALSDFQQAVSLEPSLWDALLGMGYTYGELRQFNKAETAFQQVLTINPQSAEAEVGLGSIYLSQDAYEKSEAAFKQALKLDANQYQAHIGLGHLYINRDKIDQAISDFQEALKQAPDNNMAKFGLGMAYWNKSDFKNSADQLEALASKTPDYEGLHAALANVYFQLGQDEKERQELEKAKTTGTEDEVNWYLLGGYYSTKNQFDLAEAAYQKAVQLSPEVDFYHTYLATSRSAQQKFDLALEECEAAFSLSPDSADVYAARGEVYIDMERLDQAKQDLLKAAELDPQDASTHSTLSFIYFHSNQLEDALMEANKALQVTPYYPKAYINRGFVFLEQGKLEEAMQDANEAAKLAPRQDLPHYLLGMAYAKLQQKEEAARELGLFLKLYYDRAYTREYKTQAEQVLDSLQ
jgi:tetratricopeptide (TPR) repeat protein